MGARRTLGPCLAALAVLAPATALAQASCPPDAVGCHTQDVDFAHRDALFDGVMLDTGWVPSGGPIQVRFGVIVAGETRVDMGGTAVTSWPPGLDVAVPGRPGTGQLAIDYGLEVIARLRFNLRVGGIGYSWEGDIPTAGVPTDLRLASSDTFDPFLLPPSTPRPVVVMDETDPARLYDLSLTDSLIPIPGLRGGFGVNATARLEASYRTERIEVEGPSSGPIEREGESTLVDPDPDAGSFGAAKDLTVLPVGVIDYDGAIVLRPNVYVEIAGSRFDLAPFDVPIPIADVSEGSRFDPADVHVPLPDLRVRERTLDLGEVVIGGAAERLLTIENPGEAPLTVDVVAPAAPFAASPSALLVPPRSSVRLTVRFAPATAGPASGELSLTSNDPDAQTVIVALRGTGVAPMTDASVPVDAGPGDAPPTDGGCGCRAASRSGGAGWLLALFALALRRRRPR